MHKLNLDSLNRFPALYVALSGGVDSVVLLHLVTKWAKQRKAPPIFALHVHHGLQTAADGFARHCQTLCETLSIPFQILPLNLIIQSGESVEAAARVARYDAFLSVVPEGAALLLGHHANDQAENFLLRALRGSGLRGLAGMQAERLFKNRYLLRPLLDQTRADIEQYALRHDLKWMDDPSNENEMFARNFLRQTIFPSLVSHFPKADVTLSRAAAHLQEANLFIESQLEAAFKLVCEAGEFDLSVWKTQHSFLQKLILQRWIEEKTALLPTTLCLDTVMNEVIDARIDRHPEYHWQGWWFRRMKKKLVLTSF